MPQPIVHPLRRWDPERIASYSIIGRLGAGAMGQVFLARSASGRLVAIKTIRVELAEEPGFRARFAREVAAASRVSGVFTAAVIEADPDADLPWVATAYIPAPSLSTLVKKAGPLPVPAVRWLAAGCAEALASIHGAGLLHRDVKPSNVLVALDGPRVIDFGVARAAERVQLTATRGAAGTPAYMAPEQARDATAASPASDVFSLGATLLYAATGHPPYQGETVMDILVRLATEPPDLSGLPDELSALVAACLERVPRDRPTNAAILSRLGSFALSAGHVYLPDAAMAVIADYPVIAELQEHPQAVREFAIDGASASDSDYDSGSGSGSGSGSTDDSEPSLVTGVTNGSLTPLPGFGPPAGFPVGSRADQPPDDARAKPGPAPDSPGARPRRLRTAAAWVTGRALLPLWARLLIAMLLVGSGAAIGLALHLTAPPATTGHSSADPGISAVDTTTTDPPSTDPSPTNADSPAPAGLPPSLCATQSTTDTGPQLCISQPYGDGDTVFVVHGTGFRPFGQITVELSLAGGSPRTSPEHPVADMQGTFNYAVDQGHVFFSGPLPPGNYRVMITEADGPSAATTFQVNQAASSAPPPAP
jgi:serine/threonine protein kinase